MSEINVTGITGASVGSTTGIIGGTIAIGSYTVNDYVITITQTEGDYGYTMTITKGNETQTVTLYGLTSEQYSSMLGYLEQALTAATDARTAAQEALNAAQSASTSEGKASDYAAQALSSASVATQKSAAATESASAAATSASSASTDAASARRYAQDANSSYVKARTAQQAAEAAKTSAETAASNADTSASQAAQSATDAAGSASAAAQTLTQVQAEGAAQIAAIDAEGREVLDSIPADYTALEGEVAELKSQTAELDAVVAEKAPAIILTDNNHTFDSSLLQNSDVLNITIPSESGVTSEYIALAPDAFPPFNADTNTKNGLTYIKEIGNKLNVSGTPTAAVNYYARYGNASDNAYFPLLAQANNGDKVIMLVGYTGTIVPPTEDSIIPIQYSITVVDEEGNRLSKASNLSIKNGPTVSQYSFTLDRNAVKCTFGITFRAGYQYTGVTVYFALVVNSSITVHNVSEGLTLLPETIGTNGITMMPIDGTISYIADTKKYVDEHIPSDMLVESDLVYLSPEMYGATGDGTTDDSTAIQACIDAALTKNVAVRGFGNYAVTSPISINGNNQNIFINIITYSGADAAIIVSGVANNISVTYINAYNAGTAFRLICSDRETKYNEIHIGNAIAYSNTIECIHGDDANSMYYNRLHLGRLYSRTANCVYINAYRFAENLIYGNSVSAHNGYAIYGELIGGSRNMFCDFGIETECKNGIYIRGYARFVNCRTVECMDTKRLDNDNGTIIRVAPGELPNGIKWYDTFVDYDALDVSLCRTYDDCIARLKTLYESGQTKALSYDEAFSSYENNNVLGEAFRVGTYNNMPNQTEPRFPRPGHLIAYFNKKGLVPDNDWYRLINEGEYTPFTIDAMFPTIFELAVNSSIYLNDSYCCVGIKSIKIIQMDNAKAMVYDKNGSLIFDGTNQSAGTYKLTCNMTPHTFTVSTSKGDITYSNISYYYFGMNEEWTVEKLNIVS